MRLRAFGSTRRRPGALTGCGRWAAVLAAGLVVGSATAQLSLPTTGVVPPEPVTTSLLLGEDLAQVQGWWQTPIDALQAEWKTIIAYYAGLPVLGREPLTFAECVDESSRCQAAAFRWAMEGNADDLNRALTALTCCAVVGATEITETEIVTNYLCAYDFIRPAPIDAGVRSTIEDRLHGLAEDIGDWTIFDQENNILAKRAATRALAGVMLRDQSLLNSGLQRLDQSFDKTTTDDGWFTDGQGHYLNYTLPHVIPFVRTYEQGSGVSLWSDIRPFVELTIAMRLPDGRTPNVQDGLCNTVSTHWFTRGLEDGLAAQALWHVTSGAPHSWSNVLNNDNTFVDFFWMTDFSLTPTQPDGSPTWLSTGQSRVSVFRNTWSADGDVLMVSAGIDGKPLIFGIPIGHNHHDSGELILAARGTLILTPPGYNRQDLPHTPPDFYSKPATEHNVVLVNGSIGDGWTTRPEDFTLTDRLDAVELGTFAGVADISSLETSYEGAVIRRTSGMIHDGYFFVADAMGAGSSKDYGFNLVGRGELTVLASTPELIQVCWTHDGAQVIETLVATHPMSLATDSTWMHYVFDQYEPTRRMRATLSSDVGGFLSIIEPGPTGAPSRFVPVPASSAGACGVVLQHADGEGAEVFIAPPQGNYHAAGRLGGDGALVYARLGSGGADSLGLCRSTTVDIDGFALIASNAPLTCSVRLEGGDAGPAAVTQVVATIAADGFTPQTVLRLFGIPAVTSATLNDTPTQFANGDGYSDIVLPSAGVLRVDVSAPASVAVTVELSPALDPRPDGAGGYAPLTRCVAFTLSDCAGNVYETSAEISFSTTPGEPHLGYTELPLPSTEYVCISAADPQHTLRSSVPIIFDDVEGGYVADFTGRRPDEDPPGGDGDRLLQGNLNGDEWIDVLDYGAFAAAYGSVYEAGASDCEHAGLLHADLSGDGVVASGDFTFIYSAFWAGADAPCCPGGVTTDGVGPRWSVAVKALEEQGCGAYARGDCNSDGRLDRKDVEAFFRLLERAR